jgi:hypothetical protein
MTESGVVEVVAGHLYTVYVLSSVFPGGGMRPLSAQETPPRAGSCLRLGVVKGIGQYGQRRQ